MKMKRICIVFLAFASSVLSVDAEEKTGFSLNDARAAVKNSTRWLSGPTAEG